MLLGCVSHLVVLATAIAAGLGHFSFWWTLIPTFFAGSFALSNNPVAYSRIMNSYERREWGTFPTMLVMSISLSLAVAAAAFWITRALAG